VGNLNESSKITIGGYDTERFAKENITWHNLSSNFYWSITMENVSLNGEDVDINTKKVIIDSGTSYLLMPKSKLQS
jgi:cathepsin D